MVSMDGSVRLQVEADTATQLPASSVFPDLATSSDFFERGALGYSATDDAERFDGLTLQTVSWRVDPLHVTSLFSSYFDDESHFPAGSATFDHALIMRDVEHEWVVAPDLCCSAAVG